MGRLIDGKPLDDMKISGEQIRHRTLSDVLDPHRRGNGHIPFCFRDDPIFEKGDLFQPRGCKLQSPGSDIRVKIKRNRSRHDPDKNDQGNPFQKHPAPLHPSGADLFGVLLGHLRFFLLDPIGVRAANGFHHRLLHRFLKRGFFFKLDRRFRCRLLLRRRGQFRRNPCRNIFRRSGKAIFRSSFGIADPDGRDLRLR